MPGIAEAIRPSEQFSDSVSEAELRGLEKAWLLPVVGQDPDTEEGILDRERYAHSMQLLRKFGELAVGGSVEEERTDNVETALRENWEASLVEMLQTDKEFREQLEITRSRTYDMHDGHVVDKKGDPMIGMLERGAEKSAREAQSDPRMQTQANRDAADVRNAQAVDTMPVGTLRMTLAMDPKEAMRRDGSEFWEDLGYREGVAFIQWYCRINEDTVVAGAYSVDFSDLDEWRAVWAEYDGHIPVGESTDSWLDHAISISCETTEEATNQVSGVRDRYYQKHGLTPPRQSVDEFKSANSQIIDDTFETLYKPLAIAHATGRNSERLQEVAGQLLQHPELFKGEAIEGLREVRNVEVLSDDATRLMENVIRYGLVERLRRGIRAFDSGTHSPTVEAFVAPAGVTLWRHIAGSIAGGVADGTRAGRTYGGCTPSMKLGKGSGIKEELEHERRPQDAFGGKDDAETDENDSNTGVIRCVKCREYVQKKEVVKKDCWECPNCSHKIDVCTGATLREGIPPQPHGSAQKIGHATLGRTNKIVRGKGKH